VSYFEELLLRGFESLHLLQDSEEIGGLVQAADLLKSDILQDLGVLADGQKLEPILRFLKIIFPKKNRRKNWRF
jgi:hypothetical protein